MFANPPYDDDMIPRIVSKFDKAAKKHPATRMVLILPKFVTKEWRNKVKKSFDLIHTYQAGSHIFSGPNPTDIYSKNRNFTLKT